MTHDSHPPAGLKFGPFLLIPGRRLLLQAGRPVRLGGAGLDILLLLVAQAGQLVTKRELLERVWPDTGVQEATLRLHVSRLRAALGDEAATPCYIENVTGIGYRFIAQVTQRLAPIAGIETSALAGSAAAASLPPGALPHESPLIGRDAQLGELTARIARERLVTIVGPGGVGKTALAVAAVQRLIPGCFERAYLVHLGANTAPRDVAADIAATLGLTSDTADPLAAIVSALESRKTLLVLDTCEHVARAVTHTVERVLALAPQARILATSRQSLRVGAESVLRLSALALPPVAAQLSLPEALEFPAAALFARCVAALGVELELGDSDVAALTALCHGLDGLPLALELAALRAEILGVRGLAGNLGACLTLLTRGPRTGAPRHRSLRASLDWSHATLCDRERVALRRLAVFAGSFGQQSALALLSEASRGPVTGAREILASLADKSLLTRTVSGGEAVLRLLNTTRLYALEHLEASGESAAIERRHARLPCVETAAPTPES